MQNNTQKRSSADWRATLRKNKRKSLQVIAIYIVIYLALGFIIDIELHGGFVTGQFVPVFKALITLQIIPAATIITCLVALISLWITFALRDRLMLLGTNYYEITAATANLPDQKQLYNIVEELKISAGMGNMPKIYNSYSQFDCQ